MIELTIFTPTYNRANLLPNLYQSLKNQKNKNFEWIIIDDESSDETDDVIEKLQKSEKNFEIRYYKQKHGGKHRAINKALDLAKGEYFFIVDSDDQLLDNAIETVLLWIATTFKQKNSTEYKLAGVAGLRIGNNGIIGDKMNIKENDWIDCLNFDRAQNGLLGDKAEIYVTKILRNNKFPEFEGEYFLTEAVMWNKIASLGYAVRWYNTPIYKCEYLEGGLTKSGANELNGYFQNYKGFTYYVRQSIENTYLKNNIHLIINYIKVSRMKQQSISKMANNLGLSLSSFFKMLVDIPMFCIKKKIRRIK